MTTSNASTPEQAVLFEDWTPAAPSSPPPTTQQWKAGRARVRDEACPDCLTGVDVLVGGFPCQDISVAGRRAGLAGSRSGLWWEFRRLIAELAPPWLVIENVPGLLSSNSGRDMGAILRSLGELGYGFAYRVLDAQHFGVPQRRRRVFIVGHRGGPWGAPAQVLLERESLRWHPQTGAPPREGVARSLTGSTGGASARYSFIGGAELLNPVDEIVGTLESGTNATGGTRPPGTTVDTADSLLPVDDVAYAISAGNGNRFGSGCDGQDTFVEQPVYALRNDAARNVPEVEDTDVVPAIRQGDGGSGNPMLVAAYRLYPDDDDGASPGGLTAIQIDQAPALDSTMEASKTDRGTQIVQSTVYRKAQNAHDDTDCERWEEDDTIDTLDAGRQKARLQVAIVEGADGVYTPTVAGSLQGAGGKSGQGYQAILEDEPLAIRTAQTSANHGLSRGAAHTLDGAGQAVSASGVRRLTPLECERLQGFPDTWTDIPGASDSTRYRQLGNAVAVPVVEWLARRLLGVDEGLRQSR